MLYLVRKYIISIYLLCVCVSVCVVVVHAMAWWVVDLTSHQLYPREKCPLPFKLEAGWAPDPVSTISRRKNLLQPRFEPRFFQTVD